MGNICKIISKHALSSTRAPSNGRRGDSDLTHQPSNQSHLYSINRATTNGPSIGGEMVSCLSEKQGDLKKGGYQQRKHQSRSYYQEDVHKADYVVFMSSLKGPQRQRSAGESRNITSNRSNASLALSQSMATSLLPVVSTNTASIMDRTCTDEEGSLGMLDKIKRLWGDPINMWRCIGLDMGHVKQDVPSKVPLKVSPKKPPPTPVILAPTIVLQSTYICQSRRRLSIRDFQRPSNVDHSQVTPIYRARSPRIIAEITLRSSLDRIGLACIFDEPDFRHYLDQYAYHKKRKNRIALQ